MERRNFLKGLFAAGGASILSYPKRKIDEATALVQMATPEEMAQLRQQEKLALSKDALTTTDRIHSLHKVMQEGGELYAQVKPGQFLSVGWIRSMSMEAPVDELLLFDVTTIGAQFQEYIPGMIGRKQEIYFQLIP